ncbi:MAG: hypothetical protein AAF360_11615 [Pseudomonadota bacterium]
MKTSDFIIGATTAILMGVAGSAGAVTVDFSQSGGAVLVEGQELTDFDFGGGLSGSITAVGGANEARIFDTTPGSVGTTAAGLGGGGDPDLAGPFTNVNDETDVRVFGNALIIQEDAPTASAIPDDEAGGGTVTFTFDTAIDLLSLSYLDGERGAFVLIDGEQVGEVFSGNDQLFNEVFFGDSALGVTSFTVVYNGSGAIGAFDAAISAVPAPPALPLAIAAFLGLVLVGRRRAA